MKSDILKDFPNWMLLLFGGALLVVVGSASEVKIGGNSVRISPSFNIAILLTGALLIIVALWQARKRGDVDTHGITKVEIASINVDKGTASILARVSGRIEPAKPGVRVWLVREHMAHTTGRFYPGHKAALTDRNGEWQQSTHLWPAGDFRIYAVVANDAAQSLFSYYRKAYDHARTVYQAKVDASADSFPQWPPLEELPPDCVSDFKSITV